MTPDPVRPPARYAYAFQCLLILLLGLLPPAGCSQPGAESAAEPVTVAVWKPRPCPAGEVNLIAMGDWGSGRSRQTEVARTMASYVGNSPAPFNALLTLGDNFYGSLKSTIDPTWGKLFEQMYDANRLPIPFFATIGNHDVGRKTDVELAYAVAHPESRWKLPALYYRLDLPEEAPLVTVLMLDSEQNSMSSDGWDKQTAWLHQQLAGPRATWTIVCAHRPLFSGGAHGDNPMLQREWGELFQKYRVDLYLAGHDHSLQHVEMPGWYTSFVVAGGGGAARSDIWHSDRGPFGRKIYGFTHLEIRPDSLTVRYIDWRSGLPVHEFVRKPGEPLSAGGKQVFTPQGATGTSGSGTGPIALALAATGDDYQQMQQVFSLSGEDLDRFKAALKQRDDGYKQWSSSAAGRRYAELASQLAAAKAAKDADKTAELQQQYDQARAAQEAVRRDLRVQFNGALTDAQQRRWAGHMLYKAVIGRYGKASLSAGQKQQAYAICLVLGGASATQQALADDPYLNPGAALQTQARAMIEQYVLTDSQRSSIR